jgi:hypothetical protein
MKDLNFIHKDFMYCLIRLLTLENKYPYERDH